MSRVYAVEDQWAALLARGGNVDFFGSQLTVPMERKFADLQSIQVYVAAVLELEQVRRAFPQAGDVVVRERKGQSKAHYEPSHEPSNEPGSCAVIAVPLQSRWAGRESVILHEIAHHLACSVSATRRSDAERWHGIEFRSAMCSVVTAVLGDEAALLLRTGYEEAGLHTVVATA